MGPEDGDPHTGDGGAESGMVHDLAAFVLHLHFLFGVAGIEEAVHLRQDIEGDLIHLQTYKGTTKVIIPILAETRSILLKYDYKLPSSISNQKFNDYVKELQ